MIAVTPSPRVTWRRLRWLLSDPSTDQLGAVAPLDAPPGDRVPLVAATVSWLVGVGLFAAPPDIDVPEAGAIDSDEEPADIAPPAGAPVAEPPDGAMLPLAGAIAPELAGAMEEVFAALSVADIADSAAGAGSWAGLLQAVTERAATPAATIIRVFMEFSQKRSPGPGWPAFSAHTIVSRGERA